jgi:uncharacterized RDD family membrane protein YckC
MVFQWPAIVPLTEPEVRFIAMSIARLLVVVGLLLVALGLLWPMIDKIGLGRLPGDIMIERGNFRLYIPLATSLLVSVVLSVILWIANR